MPSFHAALLTPNHDARQFLKAAAGARARSGPRLFHAAVARSLRTLCTAIISVAAQAFLGATLVDDGARAMDGADGADGAPPAMVHLWLGAPC